MDKNLNERNNLVKTNRRLIFDSKKNRKSTIFKKPHQIKNRIERFIKPTDYEISAFNTSENDEKVKECETKKYFKADPRTPIKLQSIKVAKSKNSKKIKFIGQWYRKRGEKPTYISLQGEKYTGYSAFKKSMEDKESRRKRALLEAKSISVEISEINSNKISSYGIPKEITEIYEQKGILTLYQWQVECLLKPSVLSGRNLIYSAPTSGGKTVVAEILMIRRLILNRKKALFILPYVSLVQEKSKDLKKKLEPMGYIIKSLHSSSPIDVGDETDVVVCTIEKANLLINNLLENKSLENFFSVVVIDEIHMVSDPNRGYILEILLTKINCVDQESIQIVGLSATLPNISDLAKWLKAELFVTDFRPVPLEEFYKVNDCIFDKNSKFVRSIDSVGFREDIDQIYPLCEEVISKGKSVLIFCPTKDWCKKCAKMLSTVKTNKFNSFVNSSKILEIQKEREIVIEKLNQLPGEICPVLLDTVKKGIGYHHAGMTFEEREILENAFRSRTIDILTATSTLAAGVNLPAFRVIFRGPYIGPDFLGVIKYQQMSGRAGRAGIDSKGESILISQPKDKSKIIDLMKSPLPNLKSQIENGTESLSRVVLEAITSKAARNMDQIFRFIKSTLMFSQNNKIDNTEIKTTIDYLIKNRFIESCKSAPLKNTKLDEKILISNELSSDQILKTATLSLTKTQRQIKKFLLEQKWIESRKNANEILFPTQLGNATFYSGLNPSDAIFIKDEIQKASDCLVLKGSLHICYLVTPLFYVSIEPNWAFFHQIFGSLSPIFKVTASKIGITESFLSKCAYRPPPYKSLDRKISIYRRFFISLLLFEIIKESPLSEISARFGVDRGQLQALQNSAASFAGTLAVFCRRLNWPIIASLIAHFSERVNFGVQSELIPLIQIPHVKAFRARALYDSGLKTVESVASADAKKIAIALGKYNSFKSKNKLKNGRNFQQQIELETAQIILKGAKDVLMQQLEKLEENIGEKEKLENEIQSCRNRAARFEDELNAMGEIIDELF